MAKTKVDTIPGFLGVGETTFIKKLFAETLSGEKVVLIGNELGEIGIDGSFLKNSGIEMREMSSGHICCSPVGDFTSSLKEILTKHTPDRIIIEPSGVGEFSDVMYAVADVEEESPVAGNSAVTLVDVKEAKLYIENFSEFFNNQMQYTKIIVLSRTDAVDQKKIDEAIQLTREVDKDVTIITTSISDLTGEKLFEILEYPVDLKAESSKEPAEEHEHHHRDEEYEYCYYHDEEEHEHHHHHDEEHEHCRHHDEEEHEYHHHHDEEHGHCCHHDEEEHERHHHHDEDGHCCCGHDHYHRHHGHDADEVSDSVGLENVPAFIEDKLYALLLRLAESEEFGKVARTKGTVPSVDGGAWFHFDLVPGEIEIRHGAAEASGKVRVTGSELKEEAVTRKFKV